MDTDVPNPFLAEIVDAVVVDLEKRWGDNATVYRKGNRVAVIANDGYVSEFDITGFGTTTTVHTGVIR